MNGPIRTLLLTIALALMTTAAAAQDLPSDRFGPPLILVRLSEGDRGEIARMLAEAVPVTGPSPEGMQ